MWLFHNHKKYQKKVFVTFIEDTDFIVIKDDLYKKQTEIDEDDDTLEHEIIKTLAKVVERQTKIIEFLAQPKKVKSLSAIYFFQNTQINNQMPTITIPGSANSVAGQLVPLDAGGNPLPITSIDAVSAAYTSSDNSIATVSNSAGGAFTVTRNGSAAGNVTVSYTANNADGNPVSGSDDFVFEPVGGTPELAASLTAEYQTPV